MFVRLLVCAGMAAARLAELRLSERNIEASGGRDALRQGEWSRSTYPLVVGLHVVTIVGTLLFGGSLRRSWFLVLLLAQGLRAWVLTTLGTRWNTLGAVPSEMSVATDGPYAYVRHPNYAVVAVELAALPLAFGARRLAVLATVANAVLLWPRVKEEEAALETIPGYSEHFADKPRFIPGAF